MTLIAVETWLHDARPGERIIYATGPGWLVAAARVEEKEKRTTAQQQLVAVADRLQDLADQGVVLLHQRKLRKERDDGPIAISYEYIATRSHKSISKPAAVPAEKPCVDGSWLARTIFTSQGLVGAAMCSAC
jgi:hypothetical protein